MEKVPRKKTTDLRVETWKSVVFWYDRYMTKTNYNENHYTPKQGRFPQALRLFQQLYLLSGKWHGKIYEIHDVQKSYK